MNEMDFILYGGVVVTGLIVGLGYRMKRRRGQSEPKSEAMNKINDFLATQDKEHNY